MPRCVIVTRKCKYIISFQVKFYNYINNISNGLNELLRAKLVNEICWNRNTQYSKLLCKQPQTRFWFSQKSDLVHHDKKKWPHRSKPRYFVEIIRRLTVSTRTWESPIVWTPTPSDYDLCVLPLFFHSVKAFIKCCFVWQIKAWFVGQIVPGIDPKWR